MAEIWYLVGFGSIIIVVVLIFLIDQIRQARKKGSLESTAHGSPSSYDPDSKLKMMTRLDKRESKLRRERILEGGTLPEISELVVYFPNMNEKITSPEVDVRGKTAVKSIVWINNQAAFVDVDGSFIGTIKLFKGKNIIKIVAIGPYGGSMGTQLTVNCIAKDAISQSSIGTKYLLPDISLDIRHEDRHPMPSGTGEIQSVSISKKKKAKPLEENISTLPSKPTVNDPIIASQSEIDPSVLAALKGDELTEDSLSVETNIPLEDIEPESISLEIPEDEIPPIPEIIEPEIEQSLPSIPKDVIKEDEEDEVIDTPIDDSDLLESVKLLEEVVEPKEKASSFQPDKMLPKQPGEKTVEDESIETKLAEFQPLKQDDAKTHTLVVETKTQKIDDARSTVILQHNGHTRNEDGELVQVLKIEKRIEKVKNKWFSTLGIANISDVELRKMEISEFISNTMVITEKLPINVEDPVIEHIPEGTRITWTINAVKPQMKLFITYGEDINPLSVITEKQTQPKIKIRK
ncbi:MAG: hypothetical protein JXA54_08805 [Candidatus Heimdallarchaeota archaeon]|nr:hypothetical protein [Candidatus Heimdallarchaeota archaeon]